MIVDNYLPIGPPAALPAGPLLAGSPNPPLAAPGWVELAVRLLTGLETEATQLPTTTSDCALLDVFVVRMLMSSSLSWISTTSFELVVVALAFALWMVPTEKLSWNGNAKLGSTCSSLLAGGGHLGLEALPNPAAGILQWLTSLIGHWVM